MEEIKTRVNANTFSSNVERLAINKRCDILEAMILYCDRHKIEMESVPDLCNRRLKEKLEVVAGDLNLLKEKKPKGIL